MKVNQNEPNEPKWTKMNPVNQNEPMNPANENEPKWTKMNLVNENEPKWTVRYPIAIYSA